MTATATTVVADVRRALGGRRLVWFGIRGEDGEALLQFPEFSSSVSIIAPARSGRISGPENVALEDLAGVRPDLDLYDLDFDSSEEAVELRRRLLKIVSGRCVVVTYRPSAVVSALAFAMNDTMTLAGMFKERQAAFENKPWVERSLAEHTKGTEHQVDGLGWRYVADEHKSRAKRLLAESGQLILRASRSSGGVGIVRVETEDDIETYWPEQADAFVAVSPFLGDAVPMNLSGCVFSDGTVRLHPASVQLIGIASCTDRPFGYCGNDFGAVANLPASVLTQLDELGRTVGTWLHTERYIGAFGIDVLAREDHVHFVEVNARFQGSSAMSAEIATALDLPTLFVDHLASTLGLEPADEGLHLSQWADNAPARSQVVVHNLQSTAVTRNTAPLVTGAPGDTRVSQVAHEGLHVEPGAALARLSRGGSVTETGFSIDSSTEQAVEQIRAAYSDPETVQLSDERETALRQALPSASTARTYSG